MHVADQAFFIHDAIQRHASEFEEPDFLPVQARHFVIRISQTCEWDAFVLPIAFEYIHVVRSHGKNLSPAFGEIGIPKLQARQRRAAERSHEPAQEVQQHNFVSAIFRKPDHPAVGIL